MKVTERTVYTVLVMWSAAILALSVQCRYQPLMFHCSFQEQSCQVAGLDRGR